MQADTMAAFDLKAERDKIQKEIETLERSLGPNAAALNEDVSDDSDDDLEEQLDGDCQPDDTIWEDDGSSADMCLQMNLVYQAVIEEKLQELEVLIAQNKEQQDGLMWELAGRKTQRAGATKSYPLNLALGHFMKPYFKDKVTGLGPPANPEMRERSDHIVKSYLELSGKIWRPADVLELRKAVFSDTLHRMLNPKMLKVEYLQQKHDSAKSEIDKKILKKQIYETEREIDDINQLQEDVLLGQRTDAHDWDKISNINFEGNHSAGRLCRMWQNSEHPHINKESWSEEEIKKLKEVAKDNNFVNWQAIAEQLGTKRTAFQCLQMFQRNNKDFKRSEFTKDEDEMLTHFVQRMRVGEHIPYNKISYFMEGRDGLQLLHRWTKCLDPSLKKGTWDKEEDEMLLKAVAKHGEKDWYKIRLEVPGRSDIQCRERYVKGLYTGIKKGKWSQEEKDKLVELTAKYGVGHWAQICKELPQRNAAQCLSEWKILTGYFKRKRLNRRRTRPPKRARQSKPTNARKKTKEIDSEDEVIEIGSSSSSSDSSISISSSSSSESEDEAIELMDHSSNIEISNELQSVQDLDSWIPNKRHIGLQEGKTLLLYSNSRNTKLTWTMKKKTREDSFQFNTILKGIAYPPSTDTVTETVEDFLKQAEDNGQEVLQILEEDIIKILLKNTKENERKRILRLKQKPTNPLPDSGSAEAKNPSSSLSPSAVSHLFRTSVDRKLLCAVTRWVGNVLLPLSTNCGRRFRGRTQADNINKKLSCVTITSTPMFTLLIQFFQIDAEGCLQIIRLQKVNEPADSVSRFKNTTKGTTRKIANSGPMLPKRNKAQSFNDQRPNPVNSQVTTENKQPSQKHCDSPPKIPRVRPSVPAPKLKTVSELLREKRMQKLNAAKAAKSTVVLSGNMLVSPHILVQQSPIPTVKPQTTVLPEASTTSQNVSTPDRSLSPMATCLVNDGPLSGQLPDPKGSVPVPQTGTQKTVQNRSTAVPPAQHPLPCQITMLPRMILTAPSRSVLPITFLVTPQGLISIPTQALTCPNLTQQSGSQSPRIVSMSSNSAAGTSNGSILNAPLDTLCIPTQPLSPTIRCIPQQSTVPSFPIVNSPQMSGTHLPMLVSEETSRQPSQTLPATTSHTSQDGTVAGNRPSHALPTITDSLRHEDMATTFSVVGSPTMGSPSFPMPAPSDALNVPSQTLPAIIPSIKQEDIEMTDLIERERLLTATCSSAPTPSSASKGACHSLPAVTNSLTQLESAAFSPVVSLQKSNSDFPVLTQSNASGMPSPIFPIRNPIKQEDTLVASLVENQPHLDTTCLPKIALPPGLPNKATQLKLTPQKYPIVKISNIMQTNQHKENRANVENNPHPSPVLNRSKQTANSEKKMSDVTLISLEEETRVKEWLQGKQGVEEANQRRTNSYLPPSMCTLKTFSRLLLEKKTLEANAFKLLPFSDGAQVSSRQMQETLSDMVEEKLKNNLAYQLIKQRFLSAFTIPGFLAVLPPTPLSLQQEDSDEDIDDLMNSDMNTVEATHKGNDTAADGGSVCNISEGASPMVVEQETGLRNSAENPNSVNNTKRIITRTSVCC